MVFEVAAYFLPTVSSLQEKSKLMSRHNMRPGEGAAAPRAPLHFAILALHVSNRIVKPVQKTQTNAIFEIFIQFKHSRKKNGTLVWTPLTLPELGQRPVDAVFRN